MNVLLNIMANIGNTDHFFIYPVKNEGEMGRVGDGVIRPLIFF
jgi:hypothetical protein